MTSRFLLDSLFFGSFDSNSFIGLGTEKRKTFWKKCWIMRLWCINPAFTAYIVVRFWATAGCNGRKSERNIQLPGKIVDTSIICVSPYDRIYLICTCWMIADVYGLLFDSFFSTVLELKQVLRWIKNIHQAHQIGCHCCCACTFIDQRGFQMFAYVNLQCCFFPSFKWRKKTTTRIWWRKKRTYWERVWRFLSTHKTPYFRFIFHC